MLPIPASFGRPPHCPNPGCPHYDQPETANWYRKAGFYSTLTFGEVPRFFCKSCGKYFSRQTFSIDYYAKRLVDYRYVYNQVNAGAGIRNIARDLGFRDSTITNRINRLARNADRLCDCTHADILATALLHELPCRFQYFCFSICFYLELFFKKQVSVH